MSKKSDNITAQPSPIPTAGGSRSAANDIFCKYLDESLVVPELDLPKETHLSYLPSQEAQDPIDYRLLVMRDADSIDKLVRSADELGVLRIVRHDICAYDLRSLVREVDKVYGMLVESDRVDFRRNTISEYAGNSDEVVWTIEGNGNMEHQIHPPISRRIEDLCSKMDGIAKEVDQILSNALDKKLKRSNEFRQSILSLYRHEHQKVDEEQAHHYAVTFYLSIERCGFTLRSNNHSVIFDASPDTIIISLGEQLKGKCQVEFNSTSRNIGPGQDYQDHTFSLEYKCSPPLLYQSFKRNYKMIYLADQMLIALLIICLLNFLAYSLNTL